MLQVRRSLRHGVQRLVKQGSQCVNDFWLVCQWDGVSGWGNLFISEQLRQTVGRTPSTMFIPTPQIDNHLLPVGSGIGQLAEQSPHGNDRRHNQSRDQEQLDDVA
jgi:hypothetical protein